ncbi:MAG: PPC domain-containing DNA-binding protein [Promethearchaeota archaeon]
MKSIKTKVRRVIVGKIEPDEDIIDSITDLVKTQNITSGFINIIGALKKITIGFFDLNSMKYNFKTFDEDVELISCKGNISYKEGEPIIHLHVAIGREDFSLIGGHLSQPSIVSVTGEVFIFEIADKLNRAIDPKFGLTLMDL